MLAGWKFNSTEILLTSKALKDLDISLEEFIIILNEKDKYEQMKYNLITENRDEKQETLKLSSI